MRIENYHKPQSSFLSVEKDMALIVQKLCANERLKKLLYYTTSDALDKPKLTEDQTLDLFGKNIKIVPKFYVDKEVLNYLVIRYDDFSVNTLNPEFRDNIIEFDIVCHYDQWQLKDFELRPYRIAAEIDSMLDKKHLTGIGKLDFFAANQIIINDEFAGICLMYTAIHGGEDKQPMPNPQDQKQFEEDFKQLIENLNGQ